MCPGRPGPGIAVSSPDPVNTKLSVPGLALSLSLPARLRSKMVQTRSLLQTFNSSRLESQRDAVRRSYVKLYFVQDPRWIV